MTEARAAFQWDPSAPTYIFCNIFHSISRFLFREGEQEVHRLHQKAGELWACSPASPSNFCVPLSDRSVQDLLSLQNFPECTQLIDFPLIALLIYHASAGSPCFPVFEFYPRVCSEITLIGPLLSLMSLYLNSSHGQFMV